MWNAISPRTDPCGTPLGERFSIWEGTIHDKVPNGYTLWPFTQIWSEPFQGSTSCAKPVLIVYGTRMSWLTVSKAADRSSRTKHTTSWMSMALRMSAFTLRRVVSVLWWEWYGWLVGFHENVLCDMWCYLRNNNTFNQFTNKGQVWDWSLVLIYQIQICLFE